MECTRRGVLRGMVGLAALGVSGWPRLGRAAADAAGEPRFVFVMLRGGLDGLAAVPAWGDPQYASARAGLELPPPGQEGGALRLDERFGLHPRLANLHALYGKGQLVVATAVATSYRERSHFDGQNLLENGSTEPYGRRDGWLGRALAAGAASPSALSIGPTLPLALRGASASTTWSPSPLPAPNPAFLTQLSSLYAGDPALDQSLAQARAADELVRRAGRAARQGRRGPRRRLEGAAIAAGVFLREPLGPRVAMIETGGWDTHAQQGLPVGALARNLEDLDRSIAALAETLGSLWSRTVVLVATEFGRTVAMNGSRGTDHGTASCAFLAGGAVKGGRVIGDWPGLGRSALHEGRDLKPTLDLRALQKGVLRDHLRIASAHLEREVFPDSAAAKPLDGLIRG
jgi:uncharacterized protein (DUF1501 family)